MKKPKKMFLVISSVIALGTLAFYKGFSKNDKVSRLGEYQGYSEAIYDGSIRQSGYLELSDGTKLAYDLILPTLDGVPASESLPVLFKYTPYLRTFTIFDEDGKNLLTDLMPLTWGEKVMLRIRYWVYERGNLMDPLFRTKWLQDLVNHGYAVIVVERPGTGASFGKMDPSFSVAAREVDEILNWIASQEWSDGNIGMFGDSWQAQIQFAAASTGNRHLKAIFPISSSMDNYSAVIFPGGVFNKGFGDLFSLLNTILEELATPVDNDEDRVLFNQAQEERRDALIGQESQNVFKKYPYRDSLNSQRQRVWEEVFALYPMLDEINDSKIPIYLVNGWFDLFPKDMFFWFVNLQTPKRLLVLPFDHSEMESANIIGIEAHRWFDYWLIGIDNGIMNEPSIHYSLMGGDTSSDWQTSDQWPLSDQSTNTLYFSQGRTDTADSVNDGFLSRTPNESFVSSEEYTVDYSTTTGQHSRWTAVNSPRNYLDMRTNDEKALTFTTEPLESDLIVIGHPLVQLWLGTAAPDLDVFVYLEEVDKKGNSIYITEGNLRVSQREQAEPPFDNLGLPYHLYYESSSNPIISYEPNKLLIDLLPTAYRFSEGNRIRVAITFADADNFETPILNPAPEVQLWMDEKFTSLIDIPVVSAHK